MPLNERPVPTTEEIAAAKAAGWTVKDLNTNRLTARTPTHWILINPQGETVYHGWDEEDAWRGLLKPPTQLSAIQKVTAERQRQDAKWDQQNHDAGKWSLILTEELGEVAKSQLEGDRANYLTELVQAAAVIVAWLECELRKES